MKIIFACLFVMISVVLRAQTPTVLSDSTQTPVKPDCLGDKPLYVLNNKILPCDSVQFIKPDEIHEIYVLKDAPARDLYGNNNGTIVITTKEYAKLQKRSTKNSTEIEKP